MQAALNRRDLDTLLDNLTDDVVFTTMNGDRVQGKEAVRAYYGKMLGGSGAVVKSIDAHFEADALSHLFYKKRGQTLNQFYNLADYSQNSNGTQSIAPQAV